MCLAVCRHAALKVKTASGIKRFQESKEYGSWFTKLMPVVGGMDSCQPDQAIEPSAIEIEEANVTADENLEEQQTRVKSANYLRQISMVKNQKRQLQKSYLGRCARR